MTARVFPILSGLIRGEAASSLRRRGAGPGKILRRNAAPAAFFLFLSLFGIQAGESSARHPDGDMRPALADIMREPGAFVGRRVVFLCRYAGPSGLYKPAKTRLGRTDYANFAVWPPEAELWTGAGRQNSLPSLYAARKNRSVNGILRGLRKYDLIAVSGRVVSPYSALPWIVVQTVEPVRGDGAILDETAISLMDAGIRAVEANDGAAALRHFEQALAGMPDEFHGSVRQYMARAHLLAGDDARARDCLYRVLDSGRDSPDLRLAIADLSLKLADPHAALAECATPMPRPEQRAAAMGMTAEAKALLGDGEAAFALLEAAESTPGLTLRDKAMLGVHRARIYARSGRTGDALALYDDLCLSGAALADETWLLRERDAWRAAAPGGRSAMTPVPGIAEPIVFGPAETSAGRRGRRGAAPPVDSSELASLAGGDLLDDLVRRENAAFAESLPPLPDWSGDEDGVAAYAAFIPGDGGGTAAFSFDPDHSPIIIAGYGPEAETAGGLPARNPNLYKKAHGTRRPAEVSGGNPEPEMDLYLMNGGERVHRTRVLLPAAPRGIGGDPGRTPRR